MGTDNEQNDDVTAIGFIPYALVIDEEVDVADVPFWVNAEVDGDGNIGVQEISEKQLDHAERRYIKTLVEKGIIKESIGEYILSGGDDGS